MKSVLTSYIEMFGRPVAEGSAIERIEIPLIQRDYAQGRVDADVKNIRDGFLGVIQAAFAGGEPVGLDFVYGEVSAGTLSPLDGQQRLTTMFLLHWYLASRTQIDMTKAAWTRFSYATRPSAGLFCRRLVSFPPPPDVDGPLSQWITDQYWYQYVWRHDPTIRSMLVMIDAIHERFAGEDAEALWERLADPVAPAIYFHLLPIADMGPAEDLYIKMNSRGKPLTPFETFKARLESIIAGSDRAEEFAQKVDTDWTDILWPLRGQSNTVDAEFLRYLTFIIEICEWQQGVVSPAKDRLEQRAEKLFAPGLTDAERHLDFVFSAIDTWVRCEPADVFAGLLRADDAVGDPGESVTLYGPGLKLDLFEACCRTYGEIVNKRRTFALSDTLLLYAVLLHRIHDSQGFPNRLRVLRNLNEASVANELRVDRMPALVAAVRRIILDGSIENGGFNQNQIDDEQRKETFLAEHPGMREVVHALEDHPLLRGCLAAFDLDPDTLPVRADTFRSVVGPNIGWDEIAGALLAVGDYGRPQYPGFRLGSPSLGSWWRELLTTGSYADIAPLRQHLATLLDLVAASDDEPSQALERIRSDWLAAAEDEKAFDWRYYLTRYDAMRAGRSGIYATPKSAPMGYSLAMLDGVQLNGHYRDAYLSALVELSNTANAVETPLPNLRFTGYADQPRWLQLGKSGSRLRCVDTGFELSRPLDSTHRAAFARVLDRHGIGEDLLLRVKQAERDGSSVDTEDRVQIGAALLRDLAEAGL